MSQNAGKWAVCPLSADDVDDATAADTTDKKLLGRKTIARFREKFLFVILRIDGWENEGGSCLEGEGRWLDASFVNECLPPSSLFSSTDATRAGAELSHFRVNVCSPFALLQLYRVIREGR